MERTTERAMKGTAGRTTERVTEGATEGAAAEIYREGVFCRNYFDFSDFRLIFVRS